MGFTTGFTGGVTLTLGLAYLTVLAHERNRQSQALYLRSQSQLLNSLVEPSPLAPPLSRAEIARQERSTSFTEIFKDRWNEEIENAVRWVEETDWHQVRDGMEGAVARLLGRGLEKSREEVEDLERRSTPKVQEVVEKSRTAARQGLEQVKQGVNRAVGDAVQGAEKAGDSARANANRTLSDTRAGADRAGRAARDTWNRGVEKSREVTERARADVQRTSSETIETTKGTLRSVVDKGIEKGREVINKAQEVVGLTSEKAAAALGTSTEMTDVEKALHERYERSHVLEKTVEEALSERYQSIEQRDKTVLRGV